MRKQAKHVLDGYKAELEYTSMSSTACGVFLAEFQIVDNLKIDILKTVMLVLLSLNTWKQQLLQRSSHTTISGKNNNKIHSIRSIPSIPLDHVGEPFLRIEICGVSKLYLFDLY